MIAYALDASGFFTAKSSLGADLSLVISVVAAILLTAGVLLVRRRRYEAHRWVQTVAVILNAFLVALWMVRSLWLYILPGVPGSLSSGSHALAAVHAAIGAVGVTLGIFIVVRANQLTARRRTVSPYKMAMRVAYVVYLLGVVLGIALYVVTYG